MDDIIIFNRDFDDEEDRKIATDLFNKFYQSLPQAKSFIINKVSINPDILHVVRWVCIWNDPIRVAKKCKIVATDGNYSIVMFEDDSCDIYRNEDLGYYEPKPQLN